MEEYNPQTGQNDERDSSAKPDGITHEGIVQDWRNGTAYVLIIRDDPGACDVCGARDGCAAAASGRGKPNSIAEIKHDQVLNPGTHVTLMLKRHGEWKAIAVAFVIPVILMFLGLLVGSLLRWKQIYSGLLALSTLIPYALILILLRPRLRKTFEMTIIRVES